MRKILLVILLAVLAGTAQARTIVHAGRLIDGRGATPRERVSIIVEDGRIADVVNGFAEGHSGDEVIDLADHTVMPGLMDMHVHLSSQLSRKSYAEALYLNPTDRAFRAACYARRTLLAGFTTVRNLGDDGMTTVSLRNAIRDGFVDGPRIFTAGKAISTTGGHADPTSGWCQELEGDPGPRDGVINGADEARKAVRQRYKDGADLIKIMATGGVLRASRRAAITPSSPRTRSGPSSRRPTTTISRSRCTPTARRG